MTIEKRAVFQFEVFVLLWRAGGGFELARGHAVISFEMLREVRNLGVAEKDGDVLDLPVWAEQAGGVLHSEVMNPMMDRHLILRRDMSFEVTQTDAKLRGQGAAGISGDARGVFPRGRLVPIFFHERRTRQCVIATCEFPSFHTGFCSLIRVARGDSFKKAVIKIAMKGERDAGKDRRLVMRLFMLPELRSI
jgi:hypothetical protein